MAKRTENPADQVRVLAIPRDRYVPNSKELLLTKIARDDFPDASKIGIFWLHLKEGKVRIFYSLAEHLIFGKEYGKFIISLKAHYDIWNSLIQINFVPGNSDYTDLPRGRVAYDKETKKFVIYHGNWITATHGIKPVIKNEFKLKRNVRWEPDLHYHKFKYWGFSRIYSSDSFGSNKLS